IAEPSNRGKGRGKEVLRLMMRYGIEVLCVGLFTAKIKLSNTVSRKLFESQGFILVRQTSPGTFFFSSFFFFLECQD
ncbi:hypothetical protein IscW_ISCW021123, partial [Ixodes scapularis]